MIGRYFFIISMLFLPFSVRCQMSALPISQDMPNWLVTMLGWPSFTEIKDDYFTGLDTIIGGQNWNTLFVFSSQSNDTTKAGYYRVEGPRAYFREAIPVYPFVGTEYLLYDFSAEVGDTVYLKAYWSATPYPFEVLWKDTITLGNVPRISQYLFANKLNPPWNWSTMDLITYEGAGDYRHPFYPLTCIGSGSCEVSYFLECLQTNMGVDYVSPYLSNPSCSYAENLHRLYVDHAATGLDNGASWADAFTDLQDALAVAGPGDSIWVAQGTYYPTSGADRQMYFNLRPGVAVYGGFNTTETALEQRDWQAYPTVLSGDIGVPGDSTDNSYHVLFALGVDSTALFNGFTITEGRALYAAPGYFGPLRSGGGLYVETDAAHPDCSPRIENCRFEHNAANDGGAIHCSGLNGKRANPIVRNCVFSSNWAVSRGGAFYKWGPSPEESPFVLGNCRFEFNYATGEGGALAVFDLCGEVVVEGCTFFNNETSADGGAAFLNTYCGKGNLLVKNCSFQENTQDGAGAFYFNLSPSGLAQGDTFHLRLSQNIFSDNRSKVGNGGGVHVANQSAATLLKLTISNCHFIENRAFNFGGGIDISVDTHSKINSDINSCNFIDNKAGGGGISGAISIAGSPGSMEHNRTRIANCLFARNSGGLYYVAAAASTFEANLYNCTFFRNGKYPLYKYWSPDFNDSTFYIKTNLHNTILWEPDLPLGRVLDNGLSEVLYGYTLRHCLLSTPPCDLPGSDEACLEGNLFNVYPMFRDTLNNDFRLAACSPAINAGYGAGLDTLGIVTDLAGEPRTLEEVVDIGAYEQSSQWQSQLEEIIPPTCPDSADAAVFFSTTGIAPLSYSWQHQGIAGSGNTQLQAGDYQFTLTDAAGCMDTTNLTIPEAIAITATYTSTPESPSGAANGSLVLDLINGGAPPYQFLWSTGDTTASLMQLPAGMYHVTITDANGCQMMQTWVVDLVNGISSVLSERLHFQLSPNPANQMVRLNYTGVATATPAIIQVYDATGILHHTLHTTLAQVQGSIDISITHLAPGVHWLRVSPEGHPTEVMKLVKGSNE